MNPADAFLVLGLPITATEADVKAAYRRLVGLYHPDTGVESGPAAAEKMRRINDAYAAARATWQRSRENADGPIYDPPTPPPRARPEAAAAPAGPQPPPLHQESARAQESAAAVAGRARQRAFAEALVRVGFVGATGDARFGDQVAEAFLPLVDSPDAIQFCARCDALDIVGPPFPPHREAQFLHAVPSVAVRGEQARADAIKRIQLAQVVACTDDRLLWSVSRLATDRDGLLLREDIDAFVAPFTAIAGTARSEFGLTVGLTGGAHLTFELPAAGAARLGVLLLAAQPVRR